MGQAILKRRKKVKSLEEKGQNGKCKKKIGL